MEKNKETNVKLISMDSFGNRLHDLLNKAINALFVQAEMAQLTILSFDQNINWIDELDDDETIPVSIPIGYTADHIPLVGKPKIYSKESLIKQFNHLKNEKLPLNTIFQLVTIVETSLNDILRLILIEYPNKIPSKKQVDVNYILGSSSIEEAKILIVDSILNEIAYKSPRDYAIEFDKYTGVNLLENPVFHKYIEIKATRDIHIHNLGIANDIYRAKAGVLARVKSGDYLPVDILYYLMSYEQCLQLNEVLEAELDKIWPSEKYRAAVIKHKKKQEELLKAESESTQIKTPAKKVVKPLPSKKDK